MSEEQKKAIRITIDYLDNLMAQTPDSEIANASNLLEDMLEKEQ